MFTGADDLHRQIRDMQEQGYVIRDITIHSYCLKCQGGGRIRKGKRSLMGWKPCPDCKGVEGPLLSEGLMILADVAKGGL